MIEVNVAELKLAMVKLTPKLLKQIPRANYADIQPLFKAGNIDDKYVVGWLHDSLFDGGCPRLLLRLGEGNYATYEVFPSACEKFKQIYVA